MKKIILIIALLVAGVQSWAQSTINYKALVKESGTVLSSQALDVRFTVYNGNPASGGVQVYTEVHTTSTDANGIIILNIGSGSTSDNWNNIDWSLHNQFVKTEYNTGSGYCDMGTQSFMFVPYAKYAETAGNTFSGSYADLSGTPTNVSEFTNDAGYLTSFTESDGSTTNEIQTLSVNSDQLSISGGNSVTLPTGTTYTAGTGIGITGGVISNTGDTNASDDFDGSYYSLVNAPIQFQNASGDDPLSISEDVHRMSGVALGYNQVQKGKLDIRVYGTNTNIPENVGIGIANYSTTATTQKGFDIAMTGNSTGEQYGFYSEISGTTSLLQVGTSNKLSGTGSGTHLGTYNYLLNNGTGVQTGVKNEIVTANNNLHYGSYNQLTGTGSGQHMGTYNQMGGAGTGLQYGTYNEMSNTSGSAHSGVYNILNGSGSGMHYGIRNVLSGSGTGSQYGIESYINNSNNNIHYGSYNELDGTGSGTHYGMVNQLSGAGIGAQYGLYNTIDNTGNNVHYAVRADLSGSGSGTHLAMYNTLYGSGSGNQYGIKTEITNTSTGTHYGSYANLSGSGSGVKYGSYNFINATAGGTHYAVYGSATKAGSFAGYFAGDTKITKKLLAEDSGNSDMKAYIYGKIMVTPTAALAVAEASSDGFTITRNGTGTTIISFDVNPGSEDAYIAIVSLARADYGFISVVQSEGEFAVFTKNTSLAFEDMYYNFVVYKK